MRTGALVVVVVMGVLGCTVPPGGTDPITGTLPPPLAAVFDVPADPISVRPALDTPRAVSAVLTEEGGTLTATAADGTTFTLFVPAGALVVPTRITMTPATTIEGMPFGQGPRAVQLEPEGLKLYEFASLTITPSQPIPASEQLFFGWSGGGSDFILAPPELGTEELVILLWHFSGYGATRGLRADTESVRARLGGDADARLENAVAEYLAKERQEELAGGEGSEFDLSELEALFDAYRKKVLEPRLAAAGDGCAEGKLALESALGFERQMLLLGLAESVGLDLAGTFEKLASACMREEHQLCVDRHIIHHILPAWLELSRLSELFGADFDPADGEVLVNKCLRFELKFDSTAKETASLSGFESVVTSRVQLNYDAAQFGFVPGVAPLVNTDLSFWADGCHFTAARGGGDFTALELAWTADSNRDVVDTLSARYMPGVTSETGTMFCQPDYEAEPYSPEGGIWASYFHSLHEQELDPTRGSYLFSDFTILGGDLYAKGSWRRESLFEDPGSDVNNVLTEVTGTLEVYHMPQP